MSSWFKNQSTIRGLLFVFLLCFSLFSSPSIYAVQDDVDAKSAELEQLQQRIRKLKQTLQQRKSDRDQVRSALREAEQEIGKISRTLYKLTWQVSSRKKKLEALKQQRDSLQKDMGRQRTLLAGQIRASYSMGRQEELKILLNQGDPSTVQRSLVYYDYLNRSRAGQIRDALQQLQELASVEDAIQLEYQRLQKLHREYNQQKSALEQVRDVRKLALSKLSREILEQGDALERMLADEKELRNILDNLEQALSDIPQEITSHASFASRKGKLAWPSRGKLVARFGSRRELGNMRWNGVKISAPMGREVQAISHGRVAFADWLRGYGLLLIIDHGEGFMSLYGNNQSLYKEAGEWVNDGEVIAIVGDSGGQSSSGLYFEIRQQGKPVDPGRWCLASPGSQVGYNQ